MPNESQIPLADGEWWECNPKFTNGLGDWDIPALLAEHKKRIRKEIESIEGYFLNDRDGNMAGKGWSAFREAVLNHPCLKE